MTGKIFENVNAKRLFVSLYEETPEERKATFGQNIREMFDEKITDMTRIEGFYLNEADVEKCHKMAIEKMSQIKTTKFKNASDDEDEFASPTEESIPNNW